MGKETFYWDGLYDTQDFLKIQLALLLLGFFWLVLPLKERENFTIIALHLQINFIFYGTKL